MKRNLILPVFIAILFTAIGAYFGSQRVQAGTPPSSAVTELLATSMPDQHNQVQSLAQWKGKILLVNFWATWCTPCVQEMPELSALQLDGKIKNLQIIGIGIDSAANIMEFSTKFKISYPLYVAEATGSAQMRKFGDEGGGLPFSVLIGPNGQVKKTYLGRLKMDEVKRDLAAL
jgi:thiol-disulfide isomerase/thioredoxin